MRNGKPMGWFRRFRWRWRPRIILRIARTPCNAWWVEQGTIDSIKRVIARLWNWVHCLCHGSKSVKNQKARMGIIGGICTVVRYRAIQIMSNHTFLLNFRQSSFPVTASNFVFGQWKILIRLHQPSETNGIHVSPLPACIINTPSKKRQVYAVADWNFPIGI
jgi:hypothetical protein